MIQETFPVGVLACNCTILAEEGSKLAVVIDPGDDSDQILDRLGRHGLEIGRIVCTHAHIDHVGAIGELQRRTGAPATFHQGDTFLFNRLAEQAAWLGIPAPEQGRVDRFLDDGDRVDAGGVELEVLHTPGHTPGSLTFHLESERPVLFTGDTLFLNSIGRTDLPGGSLPDILKSIETRLMSFDDDALVIPGHGPHTTIGQERVGNPFLRQ